MKSCNDAPYIIKYIETDQEYQDVLELWNSKNTLMFQDLGNDHFSNNIKNGRIVGAYDGPILVGTLKYVAWDALPYYSVGGLYIKTGLVKFYNFNDPLNPITYITDFILKDMESRGYVNWYYTRVLKKGYAKIQHDGNDLLSCTTLGSRYRRDIEEIIMPGELSKFSLHSNLVLNKTWARPIMVVKCSLDNQYRPSGNIFAKEFEFLQNAKTNTTAH